MKITDHERQYLVAIQHGAVTAQQIAVQMSVCDGTVRSEMSRLGDKGLVVVKQPSYREGGRKYPAIYGLTEAGALAAREAEPTTSIKDSCNGVDYHQWQREMRAIVRDNERARITKKRYSLPFFKIRQRGRQETAEASPC